MRRPSIFAFLVPLLALLGPGGIAPPSMTSAAHRTFIDDDDEEEEAAERARNDALREQGLRVETPSAQSESQQWWHRQRAFPAAQLPRDAYVKARAAWPRVRATSALVPKSGPGVPAPPPPPEATPPIPSFDVPWQLAGPAPVETTFGSLETPNMSPASGRSSAVVFHPTDSKIIYAGYSMGGLWKTTDSGKTWKPLMDSQPSLAVGSATLDPADPETIWVGTGEPAFYPGYAGQGIFKSTDGGTTWTKMGGDQFDGLAISRVIVDPGNGDIYAATAFGASGRGNVCTDSGYDAPGQGIYRSTDGGTTWKLLKKGKMHDLELDASVTPRILFAADFDIGVFRSIDGGTSWTPPAGLPTGQMSPKARRIEISFSEADPSIVFAGLGLGSAAAVFVSTDHGATFAQMPGAPDYCESQCYYDNSVASDPTDPNVLWVGGSLCGIWKTSDALSAQPTWVNVSMPGADCGNGDANWYLGYVHPDVHDVRVDKNNPSRVLAATDGGIAATLDGGTTWKRLNDGVSTIQFYNVCTHPTDPNIVYGGTQDNGIMRSTDATGLWHGLVSGDGGPCAVDPGNPDVVLISGEGASVLRSSDGFKKSLSYVFNAEPSSCTANQKGCGDRVSFIAPLVGDPATPGTFYVGTHRLWRSTDGGLAKGWTAISDDLTAGSNSIACPDAKSFPKFDDALSVIAVAPSAPGTIYTGSEGGVMFATTDGGGAWNKISNAPLPVRFVSGIAVDPLDDKIVYAAFSGFSENTPNTPGHVFRSTDAGVTWEPRDIGVDLPVNSIATHPFARDLVYAGTDLGVLVSTDGGVSWSKLGTALPNVAVFSLVFQRAGNALLAATHGRSMWTLPFPQSNLTASPASLDFKAIKGKGDPKAQTVNVTVESPYGSSTAFNVASGSSWLTVDRVAGVAAGAVPIAITVNAAVKGQSTGSTDGTVVLTPVDTTLPPLTVKVKLTIDEPAAADDGGCGCRAASNDGVSGFIGVSALSMLLALRRRRRAA